MIIRLRKILLLRFYFYDAFAEWKHEVWQRDLDELYCCNGENCGCGGITVSDAVGINSSRKRIKFPRFSYTNMKKEFPNIKRKWNDRFSIDSYWGGNLIHVSFRHHLLAIDTRNDFIKDMVIKAEEGK